MLNRQERQILGDLPPNYHANVVNVMHVARLPRKNYSASGIRKHLSQYIKTNEFLPSKVNKLTNVHALDTDKIKELNELLYEMEVLLMI